MRVFKKILCPVDFSDYSSLAFRYAVALAKENDAPLVVCHSIPDLSREISYLQGDYEETVHEALISNAKDKLDQFVGKLLLGTVNLVQIIERGRPAEKILQTARSTGSDLIIMGTHGHSGYEKFLMGSVTNKVLHKARVPVLTVCRPTHHFIRDHDSVEIKNILCALDYEFNSRYVAKIALEIGRMYQAGVTFFHAVPRAYPKEWSEQEEWCRNRLTEFVDPSREEWCKVKFLIRPSKAAEEILKWVKDNNIDLIVLGHHSRKAIEELSVGSVAKKVVTEATCPVLVGRSYLDVPSTDITLI